MRCLVLVLLTVGCGARTLFLERPWDEDQTVVLVALAPGDDALAPPAISTGGKIELALLADPPFSLYAYVFAKEVLDPSCPISIGGEGSPIPAEREVWSAEVTDLSDSPVFASADAPGIEVNTTCSVAIPCPSLELESMRIDELSEGNIVAIVPLSSTRALVANDQSPSILDIDGAARRMIDTSSLSGAIRSLAADGDTIAGATSTSVFRLDLSSESFEVEPATGALGLEPVPNAPPVIYGDFGVREVLGAASGTTAIERVELQVRHLRLGAANSGLLVDDASRVYYFSGIAWSLEQPSSRGLNAQDLRRIDGDERSLMIVGDGEHVFLRSRGSWEQLPLPFFRGLRLFDVESLGDDRYFVVGEYGSAALWRDGWCTYQLDPQRHITRIAVAPDGKTFFAGTRFDAEGSPLLIRFTLE